MSAETFDYDISILIDAGECFQPLDECLASINAHLSTMGIQEQMKAQSRIPFGVVTVTRELSERDIDQMRTIIKAQLLTSELTFRRSILGVELIRRKPGNVSFVSP